MSRGSITFMTQWKENKASLSFSCVGLMLIRPATKWTYLFYQNRSAVLRSASSGLCERWTKVERFGGPFKRNTVGVKKFRWLKMH